MYVVPHYWDDVPPGDVPIAIGTFNALQLAGGGLVAYVFGWLVALSSYSIAWEVLAAFEVVTLVALLALPRSRGAPVPPVLCARRLPPLPGGRVP